MAIEIVGNPEDVKRYRKILHDRGTYTKRFGAGKNGVLLKPDDYRTTTMQVNVKKIGEDSNQEAPSRLLIEGIANENAVDRMDERLEPSGIDIENFKKNPVLLVDHMYLSRAVVGKVLTVVPEDNGVKFGAELAQETDEGFTDAQRDARILVKQGLLKTVSVGFIPKKIRAPEFDNEGRLIEPPVILNWELLEISLVAVPANPGSTFEMKEYFNRFSSYKNNKSNSEMLTANNPDSIIVNSKDLTREQMEEIQKILGEILAIVKANTEAVTKIADDFKAFYEKAYSEDDDEEEIDDQTDTEDEDEEEKEKALEEMQVAIKSNSEAIQKIASILEKLMNG